MKKFLLTISILTFALFSQCAYFNTFYNAQKFYKEAEKERKKREKTSIVELSAKEQAELEKRGRSAADVRNRASRQEMQNYQKAIERASRVLEFYPDSRWVDDALMLLGKCFYYRRDYNKAQRKFDEVLANFPDSDFAPEAQLLKAKTFIGLEEYETAEEHLRRIVADEDIPKDTREAARYELGGLYYQSQNYEQAAENYQQSIDAADNELYRALALYRLGECLLQLEEYEKAPNAFERAIDSAPNDDFQMQSMFKLGRAYSLNGDYKKALKTFRKQLSREYEEKRIPRIKLQLAHNLRKSGELDEAIDWYETIIEEHERTDASARAYYALGEIEEFVKQDYYKAKENYDMVRSEFSGSLIAPDAQERSNNIRSLMDLKREIADMEGREFKMDSSATASTEEAVEEGEDDGPIDLSPDGMWVNYSGRNRPAPRELSDLGPADFASQQTMQAPPGPGAEGDSLLVDSTMTAPTAQIDSAEIAKQRLLEKQNKKRRLASKYLSLAEVMLINFNKPDSAIKYYHQVATDTVDSTLKARAMYSLAYVYRDIKNDTTQSTEILNTILEKFPETSHAEGARKLLGLPLHANRVDTAKVLFKQGEDAYHTRDDLETAFALWDSVIAVYPESKYAQKAAYAKAWHLENTLYKMEQALEEYDMLLEKYPESPFKDKVKPKLMAVEQKQQQEQARADSIARADSLAQRAADSTGQTTLPDSLAQLPADSTGQLMASDSLQHAASDSLPNVPEDSLGQALQEIPKPATPEQNQPEELEAEQGDSTKTQPPPKQEPAADAKPPADEPAQEQAAPEETSEPGESDQDSQPESIKPENIREPSVEDQTPPPQNPQENEQAGPQPESNSENEESEQPSKPSKENIEEPHVQSAEN